MVKSCLHDKSLWFELSSLRWVGRKRYIGYWVGVIWIELLCLSNVCMRCSNSPAWTWFFSFGLDWSHMCGRQTIYLGLEEWISCQRNGLSCFLSFFPLVTSHISIDRFFFCAGWHLLNNICQLQWKTSIFGTLRVGLQWLKKTQESLLLDNNTSTRTSQNT